MLPTMALGLDLLGIVLTMVGSGLGREHLHLFSPTNTDLGPDMAVAEPILTLTWITTIALLGGYDSKALGIGTDEFRRVVNGSFLAAGVVGIGCYLIQFELSRGFFVLAFTCGVPLLLLERSGLRYAVRRARQRGALVQRVLIVGAETHVDDVVRVLARETWLGYDVVGALTPTGASTHTAAGVPVLGTAATVVAKSQELNVDVAFFAGGAVTSANQLRQIAWALEGSVTQVIIAPSVTDVSRKRINVRPVGGMPLIHLEKPHSVAAVRRAKRAFDVIGSFSLLVASSPVFLFAALRVHLHDDGPVFFRQNRVGRDGRTFYCWRFRTMVINAEELLEDHPRQQGNRGLLLTMEHDPRVTGPGRWLRRYSLDQLPQLWNVLKGDMSLVGPRPPHGHEVAQYDDDMTRRLRVRPGMTGLWQVSGRSDLSWSEAIRLDLYYVDNWSMVQDLAILARTAGAALGFRRDC